MTGYQTQQRGLLISFFESHPDEAFTIDEILQRMRTEQDGALPSRSTVYRTVADLEKENYLKRVYLADRHASAYQYRDPRACEKHLHIRCEKCNALMHLDANVSDAIAKMLQSDANVSLDIGNTILVGCCEKCSHKE